jgi:hypothetical protein
LLKLGTLRPQPVREGRDSHALRLICVTLAIVTTAERAVADTQFMPAAMVGSWRLDCAGHLPDRLRFDRTGAEVVSHWRASTCRLAGHRALTPSRWYLDLACADGSLLQLDVNAIARDRLLIARRPLGEACFYLRVPGPGAPYRRPESP